MLEKLFLSAFDSSLRHSTLGGFISILLSICIIIIGFKILKYIYTKSVAFKKEALRPEIAPLETKMCDIESKLASMKQNQDEMKEDFNERLKAMEISFNKKIDDLKDYVTGLSAGVAKANGSLDAVLKFVSGDSKCTTKTKKTTSKAKKAKAK